MNADSLVLWVRCWVNSRVSQRHIRVHLRSSAAKIPCFLIRQPQPNETRQGARQSLYSGGDRSGFLETLH